MKRSPLARKTPLAPGTKPMKRGGRVRAVNPKRRKALSEEQFGEKAVWIRAMPCCVCGYRPPSDPHHVKSRGAGGRAEDVVPLCRLCHDWIHASGRYSFERAKGIDLRVIARCLHAEWEANQGHGAL